MYCDHLPRAPSMCWYHESLPRRPAIRQLPRMKRFHVHVVVESLTASIRFYSQLFDCSPTTLRPDYAKWMLDQPGVNFAISVGSHGVGLNHFGFQAESQEELAELKRLAESASDGVILAQPEAACCYAKGEKYWTLDPQGLAWEQFLTTSDALTIGNDVATQNGACCIPLRSNSGEIAGGADCCLVAESTSVSSR